MEREPVSSSTFLIFLKPDPLVYKKDQTSAEVLKELEVRIRGIQAKKYGSDKRAPVLKPIERVLYGMKLIDMPGYSLLKMAQLFPTSVYKNYLYADINDSSRIYVELVEEEVEKSTTMPVGEFPEEPASSPRTTAVEKKVFIFMVCDREGSNFSGLLRLI